jgi:predicted secreted protein
LVRKAFLILLALVALALGAGWGANAAPNPGPTLSPSPGDDGPTLALLVQVQPDGSWRGEYRRGGEAPSTGAGGAQLAGSSLTELARAVHDEQDGLGALAGPMELVLEGTVRAGQTLRIALKGNLSTGYSWSVAPAGSENLRPVGALETAALAPGLGVPDRQALEVRALSDGRARLRLVYRRPWEADAPPVRAVAVHAEGLGLADLCTALSLPVPPSVEPAEAWHGSDTDASLTDERSLAPEALPSAFNWCALGKCTPVRNQGNCGSCWAFATVGPMESGLLIANGTSANLSEQYLVSCNTEGWGCDGGWWAHDYHQWKRPPSESEAGAVLESAFPYVASKVPCNGPYSHPYRIATWAYVGSSSGVPATSAIKQAIYDHGPVAAAVCVGTAFQNYRGGVFSTNETCSGSVNHGIVLVGWSDAAGAWILRNSWGTGWGVNGYMTITYGTSMVGFAANYVTLPMNRPARARLPLVLKTYGSAGGLRNGGFENGRDGSWSEYSSNGWSLILPGSGIPVGPHSGNWAAWLGGDDNETSILSQIVTVPGDASVLAYWMWSASQDYCGYDYAYVRFGSTTLRTYNLCSSANTGAWVYQTLNVAAYRGQSVDLRFVVTTDSSLNSNFFLDDVSFSTTAATAAPAGPAGGLDARVSKADWGVAGRGTAEDN